MHVAKLHAFFFEVKFKRKFFYSFYTVLQTTTIGSLSLYIYDYQI